ncbi:microfibril-associated glycoprotein 4-like [Argopecten irradians]|uniref:microfibril-associated glycoprotein 4-like n=1 Tax=Argopecten irradians TaxID=31199 RepID=UPI003718E17D
MNVLITVLIFLLHSPYIKTCREFYKQNPNLKRKLFTSGILHEHSDVMKFQECLRYCKKHHCLSFSTNTETGLCRLYSKIFNDATGAISQDGVAYYYQWSDTCLGWRQSCSPRTTGVYDIRRKSKQNEPHSVLCDMDIEAGGWTVFQNRFDGSVSFDHNKYQQTFGNLSGEFWLGLDRMKTMCFDHPCEARIELEDWQGIRKFAAYSDFKVGSYGTKYTLTISGYSGTAGDAMGDLNGMKFSTANADFDMSAGTNCADLGQSGWWYNDCGLSNLNGPYTVDSGTEVDNAMTWRTFHGSNHPLKKSRMMFRAIYNN